LAYTPNFQDSYDDFDNIHEEANYSAEFASSFFCFYA